MAIDLSGIEEIDGRLAKLIEEFPAMRRVAHERIADAVKDELDLAVDQVGLQDNSGEGKVKGWQVPVVGSGGGYAKVRPKGSNEGADTGPNSPGAITNYLEKGHAIRKPSGRDPTYAKRRKSRIRVARVPGRNFYAMAAGQVDNIAIREAEALLGDVAALLEG